MAENTHPDLVDKWLAYIDSKSSSTGDPDSFCGPHRNINCEKCTACRGGYINTERHITIDRPQIALSGKMQLIVKCGSTD